MRRRADFYAASGHPGLDDILLLVEAADSSLGFDRTLKLSLYAQVDIAGLWIMEPRRRTLDPYSGPAGYSWVKMTADRLGEQVTLVLAPEIILRLDLMFD